MPEIETLGFECVKMEVVGSSRNPVLRLYIDKPGEVSVGDYISTSAYPVLTRGHPEYVEIHVHPVG